MPLESVMVTGTPLPDDHPFRAIHANPRGRTSPEIWILGSSDYGARLAAHFGLPYAFAYFFADGQGVEQALGREQIVRVRRCRSAHRCDAPAAGISAGWPAG